MGIAFQADRPPRMRCIGLARNQSLQSVEVGPDANNIIDVEAVVSRLSPKIAGGDQPSLSDMARRAGIGGAVAGA